MAYVADKKEILGLLVENLNDNAHPQIVEAESIAEKLGMNKKELCQIVKKMREMGEVESDQEGQRVLITRQGLNWVSAHSPNSAASMS